MKAFFVGLPVEEQLPPASNHLPQSSRNIAIQVREFITNIEDVKVLKTRPFKTCIILETVERSGFPDGNPIETADNKFDGRQQTRQFLCRKLAEFCDATRC